MTAPDPAPTGTRGELLRQADATVAGAERSLFSARRTLPVLGWSIGLLLMTIFEFTNDLDSGVADLAFFASLAILWWLIARLVPGRAFIGHMVAAVVIVLVGAATLPLVEDLGDAAARGFFIAVWAAFALGVAWTGWRFISSGRALVTEIRAAFAARRDPAGLSLDDADVTPDVATVHDLRDRADLDDAMAQVLARRTSRLYDLTVLKPTFVLMITGVAGLAFVLAPLVGLDDSGRAVATVASGLLLLAPWAWAFLVDLIAVQLVRQDEVNRITVESRLYATRRHHTQRAELTARRRTSLLGTPVGMFLLVAWICVLVLRLRSSSSVAIVIALVIVFVVAGWFIARSVVRSRQTRIFPLAGRGGSILQEPARQVTLTLTTDQLQISDDSGGAQTHAISIRDILAVEPVSGLSALVRSGIGIVTTGDPIVLAGSRVTDDPAIVELRSRLAPSPS